MTVKQRRQRRVEQPACGNAAKQRERGGEEIGQGVQLRLFHQAGQPTCKERDAADHGGANTDVNNFSDAEGGCLGQVNEIFEHLHGDAVHRSRDKAEQQGGQIGEINFQIVDTRHERNLGQQQIDDGGERGHDGDQRQVHDLAVIAVCVFHGFDLLKNVQDRKKPCRTGSTGLFCARKSCVVLFHPDCNRRLWIYTKSALSALAGFAAAAALPPVGSFTPP